MTTMKQTRGLVAAYEGELETVRAQRDTLLAAAKAALPWMLVERREGKQRADELREAIAQAEGGA